MAVGIVKLLFDFGLLVLIWIIQLVVYPSFSYYPNNDLLRWHKKYTLRIGYIVMPLMVVQLILSVLQSVQNLTMFNVFDLVLILMVWLSTFLQFVPLHHKISSNFIEDKILDKLVSRNWQRTILWTIIFGLSLANYLLNPSYL